MKLHYPLVLSCLVALTLVSGCGNKQQATPPEQQPATPEQLVEIWDQLISQPVDQLDFTLARAVATDMLTRGENGIKPILDRLDVADPSPQSIVLASAALRDLVDEKHEAELIRLTEATHSSPTRRVAIDLLGGVETDSAVAHLAELEKDGDLLISTGAYLARLHMGDADYVARMKTYWDNPGVHDASRQEMLRRLPDAEAKNAVEFLCAAVVRPDWDADVRRRAASALGFMIDQRALEALKAAAETTPEAELREYIAKAADAMQVKLDAGLTVEEVEVGSDGVHKVSVPLTTESPKQPAPAE